MFYSFEADNFANEQTQGLMRHYNYLDLPLSCEIVCYYFSPIRRLELLTQIPASNDKHYFYE